MIVETLRRKYIVHVGKLCLISSWSFHAVRDEFLFGCRRFRPIDTLDTVDFNIVSFYNSLNHIGLLTKYRRKYPEDVNIVIYTIKSSYYMYTILVD